jgi:hypothetical protein
MNYIDAMLRELYRQQQAKKVKQRTVTPPGPPAAFDATLKITKVVPANAEYQGRVTTAVAWLSNHVSPRSNR